MRSRLLLLLAAVAIGVFPSALMAQVDTGTIVGTVKDATGAVLPNATIVITAVDTGIKTTVSTGAAGTYVATPLRIGEYTVAAEAAGFKTETRKNIVLQVQDRLRIDFELQVGDRTDQVVVEAAPPALQTETSSLGDVITSNQVTSLPLNGRDYTQLAALTAGVSRTDQGDNGNNGGSFAANGTRATLNNFLLDGIDNNSNDNGRNVLQTSVDAIAEFKVQTNSYSAEFGRSGGAVINATIKSGSNKLTGTAFEFLRNSALDARNFFASADQPKPIYQLNQFGGTLGGPIIRNKTFFFTDYQGSRLRNGQTLISTVPQAAERNGDFSASGRSIFDPSTTDPSNGNARQPFDGNKIPASRIDPVAKAFMDLYPDPNVPGQRTSNFVRTGNFTDWVQSTNVRIDHNFSTRNQLFGRFAYNDQHTETPSPLPGLANGGGSRVGDTFINAEGVSLGDTFTLNPATINEFRLGFTRLKEDRGLPFAGQQFPPPALRIPGVPDNAKTNGLAQLQPSGFRNLGDGGFSPTLITTYESQLSDTMSMIRGKHTVKFGVQLRRSQFNIFQVNAPRGRISFNGRFTRNPATGTGGYSLADMLLGLSNGARLSSLSDLANRQGSYGAFFMDDWKVTPRLTLNLGLRYDYTTPIVEAHDRQANLDFATGAIVVPDLSKVKNPGPFKFEKGNNRSLVDGDKLNFAPRIGFAWTPFANGKTVLRGGYGIYYSAQEYRTAGGNQLAYNIPFYIESFFASNVSSSTSKIKVSTGFPSQDLSQVVDVAVVSADSRLKSPYYQHWNLNVQHESPWAITLEVGYAGSKGTHLQVGNDRNQVPKPIPGNEAPDRPYPQYGPFLNFEDRGNSNYHALQVKGTKRLSHGLDFLSAFTYGKSIDDQGPVCCSYVFPQDSQNQRAERGRSDFDQRFRWVNSFNYDLPFGAGHPHTIQNRLGEAVLGGWSFGGIITFGSGFPFTPSWGDDSSRTYSEFPRPNRIRDGNLPKEQRTVLQWFDTDAFVEPALFTFGNSGRNIIDGPGVVNVDFALHKVFSVSERSKIQFRVEFFNALNHPNLGSPGVGIGDDAGIITTTSTRERQIQFALKVLF
ncbi:MAG TPA: TonB-dependent receptor [Acidobacteriota bacterium]|nr:TonB-dependent receptor [Acidobacteriota bacterium]